MWHFQVGRGSAISSHWFGLFTFWRFLLLTKLYDEVCECVCVWWTWFYANVSFSRLFVCGLLVEGLLTLQLFPALLMLPPFIFNIIFCFLLLFSFLLFFSARKDRTRTDNGRKVKARLSLGEAFVNQAFTTFQGANLSGTSLKSDIKTVTFFFANRMMKETIKKYFIFLSEWWFFFVVVTEKIGTRTRERRNGSKWKVFFFWLGSRFFLLNISYCHRTIISLGNGRVCNIVTKHRPNAVPLPSQKGRNKNKTTKTEIISKSIASIASA